MTGNNRHFSELTVNVNGPHAPTKRHGIASWIENKDPTIFCFEGTHLTEINKHWLTGKVWEKNFPSKCTP
jgi:hypothetical protein